MCVCVCLLLIAFLRTVFYADFVVGTSWLLGRVFWKMHVGLILLHLSPSGRKIVCFGFYNLTEQKAKEHKNISVGKGKAPQSCKNTPPPLTLSRLLLSLQKRPSAFKDRSKYKGFGYMSSASPLEGWSVPSCLGQVMISATGSNFCSWLQVPSEWDH